MKTRSAIILLAITTFFCSSCSSPGRSHTRRISAWVNGYNSYKPEKTERIKYPKTLPRTDCDIAFASTKAPAWVVNPSQVSNVNYIGFGMKEGSFGDFQNRIEAAHANALKSLANSIQVRVESSLSTHISNINGRITNNFQSISRNYTNILVKGATRSDMWINKNNCNIWIKVIVSKIEVEKILNRPTTEKNKLSNILNLISSINNNSLYIGKRIGAAETARKELGKVDFKMLNQLGLTEYSFNHCLRMISEGEKSLELTVQQERYKYIRTLEHISSRMHETRESLHDIPKAKSLINGHLKRLNDLDQRINRDGVRSLINECNKMMETIKKEEVFLSDFYHGMTYEEIKRIKGEPQGARYNTVFVDCVNVPGKFWCKNVYEEVLHAVNYSSYWFIFEDKRLSCAFRDVDFMESPRADCYYFRNTRYIKSVLSN